MDLKPKEIFDDFQSFFNKTKTNWSLLQKNIIDGQVKEYSSYLKSLSPHINLLSKKLFQSIRAYVIKGFEIFPIQFLKLTFPNGEHWGLQQKFALAEVLNTIFFECEATLSSPTNHDSKPKARLLELARHLLDTELLASDVLEKTLSIDFIDQLKIVEAQAHRSFLQKRRTAMSVSNKRYLKLYENSEGYSRLIMALTDLARPEQTSSAMLESPEKTGETLIKMFIGKYDLAPEKVIDIILCFIEEGFVGFLPLISIFPQEIVAQGLGSTFSGFADSQNAPIPFSLIKLTAILMRTGIVSIQSLYRYLPGSDEQLANVWASYCSKQEKLIETTKLDSIAIDSKEKTIPILPSFNIPLPHLACPKGHDDLRESSKNIKGPSASKSSKKCRYCMKPSESMALCGSCQWEACVECSLMDTKFRLYNCLLRDGNGSDCKFIEERIGCEFLASHPVIMKTLFDRLDSQITLVSAKMHQSQLSIKETLIEINKLKSHLEIIGIYLYKSKRLFVQSCRLIASALKRLSADANNSPIANTLIEIIKYHLVPAFASLESSYVYAEELWAAIRHLDYTKRYEIYGLWLNESNNGHAETRFSAKSALQHSLRFRKMCLHKDNKAKVNSAKSLLKFIHCQPAIVVNDLLNNIKHRGYDVLIKYLVESFKYVSDLIFDVVMFCTLNLFSRPNSNPLEENGFVASVWFQNLAEFIVSFVREFPLVDFRPLIKYIDLSTAPGSATNFYILNRILREIGSISIFSVMELSKEDEVNTSYSGILKSVTLEGKRSILAKNSVRTLRSAVLLFALFDTESIASLLIKTAQNMASIFWTCDLDLGRNGIQTLSFQHSICTRAFFGVSEFLLRNLDMDELASYTTSFENLHERCGLRPQEIFHLKRRIFWNAALLPSTQKNKSSKNQQAIFQADQKCIVKLVHQRGYDKSITPEFYLLFWLGDYSLMTNRSQLESLYDKCAEELSKECRECSEKDAKEQEKSLALITQKLEAELAQRRSLREAFEQQLASLDNAIKGLSPDRIDNVFLECCVLPRCVYSPHDSVYSSMFLFQVLKKQMPGFSYANFTKNLIEVLPSLIHSATVDEASNFGRFLRQFLSTSLKFCNDKFKFEKMSVGNPCFKRGNKSFYDVDEFRLLFYRIHDKFFFTFAKILKTNAKKELLKDVNVGITNTAYILTQIKEVFPFFLQHVEEIKLLAQLVIDLIEEQNNLKTVLTSLAGILDKNREPMRPERFSRKFNKLSQSKQRMESIKQQLLEKRQLTEEKPKRGEDSRKKLKAHSNSTTERIHSSKERRPKRSRTRERKM